MDVAVFSTKPYDQRFLTQAADGTGLKLTFFEPRLTAATAPLASGFPALCIFVNDELDAEVLSQLEAQGTQLLALRCAGFNNVDLKAAGKLNIKVARVPAYSPYAVAEHCVGMMLALNRKLHRASARVREGNFSLDGLLGFDMHGKTVGIIGTGKIGQIVLDILKGFGCRLLAYDPYPNPAVEEKGARYTELDELVSASDVISLHCPLAPQTRHIINAERIEQMKPGVMLINTSRGALVNTAALVEGLKSGKLGSVGLDVYEEEADLFFEDLSNNVLQDDVFARLLTFPNVIVTGHQAFFTQEALQNIAETTIGNIVAFEEGQPLENEVQAAQVTRVISKGELEGK